MSSGGGELQPGHSEEDVLGKLSLQRKLPVYGNQIQSGT